MARQLEIESIVRTPSFDYARRVFVGLIAGLIVSIVISAGVWSLAIWFPSKASLAEIKPPAIVEWIYNSQSSVRRLVSRCSTDCRRKVSEMRLNVPLCQSGSLATLPSASRINHFRFGNDIAKLNSTSSRERREKSGRECGIQPPASGNT